jgi:quinoprotein glucose dehydrogenase
MHTYRDGLSLRNRVIRLTHLGNRGQFDRVIIDSIPGGRVHNGGRIAFGPDGLLYITAGETWNAHIAQDLSSLGGKILRVAPDGSIPADNPFPGSPVWSYGHRNPQGLAWSPDGILYESEHGPSGEWGLRGHDEINVIRKGANYGWPLAIGAAGVDKFADPIAAWQDAVPPAGAAWFRGSLFVATLRSEALLKVSVETRAGAPTVARIERWFAKDDSTGVYGRLRDVVVGPDGALYVLTSNRDGRGSPREGDDRILRLVFPEE